MVTEEQERELERRQSRLKPKKKSLAEQERELEAKQTRLAPRSVSYTHLRAHET